MSKVFLILAIVAAGAAAFVANGNKATFAEVHESNKDLSAEISQLKRDNSNELVAIDDANSELATAENTRDEAQARRDYSQSNLADRTKAINARKSELNRVNTEIQEVQTILGRYNLPSPDALNASLEEESAKQIELQEQIDEQTIAVEGLRSEVNDKRGVLANLRKTVAERDAEFNVKTRRATIQAVDPEWGFAIIRTNAAGISANDRVIVERGGQRVGMLVVKTVEGSKVVADVVPEASVGVTVQPGDTVIFDKKKQES